MTDKTEGLEVVAYHYCVVNAFGHPVWDVGYHVPREAVEEHGLTRITSAQEAVAAERRDYIEKCTELEIVHDAYGERITALETALKTEQALSFRNQIAGLESAIGVAQEALQYSIKQVPELATVPGVSAAITLIDTTLGTKT